MPGISGTPPFLTDPKHPALNQWVNQFLAWLQTQELGDVLPTGTDKQILQFNGTTLEAATLSGDLQASGATGNISVLERAYWIKRTVTYADLAAASQTGTALLETIGGSAFGVIGPCLIKHSEAFVVSGSDYSQYHLTVGETSDPDGLLGDPTPFDAHAAIGPTVYAFSDTRIALRSSQYLRLAADCGAGRTLDEATAGSVDVWYGLGYCAVT